MKNNKKISKTNNIYVDNFHEFMIKNATFDGLWEFPIIKNNVYKLPKYLIGYDQRKRKGIVYEDSFVHFYIDDYKFDGPNGIWNGSSKNLNQKRGFSIDSLAKFSGIIGPDFSVGFGFPLATQLDSIRRTRYFEHWMTLLGIQVIPNIRWTDERSYEFCFLGIPKNSIVAISTLGVLKYKTSRKYFKLGLIEMLKRIEPSLVLIYGDIPSDVFQILENQKILCFKSDISSYRQGGKTNGCSTR